MNPINKIFLGIVLALAFVAVIAFLYLIIVNAHLKTELAEAQSNDTACHMANDDFVTEIAKQNNAIEDMKSESVERARNARAAEASAQKIAKAYADAAKKLAARKANADLCASSDKMLNDYLNGLK